MAKYVSGMPQLKRAMTQIPDKIVRRILNRAVREGTVTWVNAAKTLAPARLGVLKRNITKKKLRTRRDFVVYIGGVETGQSAINAEGKVEFKSRGRIKARKATRREKRGEDPFYYRFQELGFTAVGRRSAASRDERKKRKAGSGSYGRWIPGRHFLENAFTQNIVKINNQIEQAIARGVDEALK